MAASTTIRVSIPATFPANKDFYQVCSNALNDFPIFANFRDAYALAHQIEEAGEEAGDETVVEIRQFILGEVCAKEGTLGRLCMTNENAEKSD